MNLNCTQADTCIICDGFGRVYPRKKDNTVDYKQMVYCECQGDLAGKGRWQARTEDEIKDGDDHYTPGAEPEDFDFPISWDWHRYNCVRSGRQDPGSDSLPEPEETPSREPTEHLIYPALDRFRHEIDEVKGMNFWLQNKIAELTKRKQQEEPF